MQAGFLCIGPKGDPRKTHLAGFCSIGLAQIYSRKSAFLRTALAFNGHLVTAVRRGEGEPGNNKRDNGSLTRNTTNRIFCLSARCRGNQEKWNGAARDLELAFHNSCAISELCRTDQAGNPIDRHFRHQLSGCVRHGESVGLHDVLSETPLGTPRLVAAL
jgi:hypothetical protein